MIEPSFARKPATWTRRQRSSAIAFLRSVPWTATRRKSSSGRQQSSRRPPMLHCSSDSTTPRKSRRSKTKPRTRSCWGRPFNMDPSFNCSIWSPTNTWQSTSDCRRCWRRTRCAFTSTQTATKARGSTSCRSTSSGRPATTLWWATKWSSSRWMPINRISTSRRITSCPTIPAARRSTYSTRAPAGRFWSF